MQLPAVTGPTDLPPIGEAAPAEHPEPHRHVIVTLRLPDRPGALGAVASRIGSVGADITDVQVASRRNGIAEDVFHIDLPDRKGVDIVGLLLGEVHQVDGVVAPSISEPPPDCCS